MAQHPIDPASEARPYSQSICANSRALYLANSQWMLTPIAAQGTVTRGLRRSGFDAIMIAHGRRFSSCLPRRSALPRQNCSRIMTVASLELLPRREPGGGTDEAGQHGDEGRVACSSE